MPHATNLVPVRSYAHLASVISDPCTDRWNRVGQKLKCSAHFRFDSFIFARLHARGCKPVLPCLSSRERATGPRAFPPLKSAIFLDKPEAAPPRPRSLRFPVCRRATTEQNRNYSGVAWLWYAFFDARKAYLPQSISKRSFRSIFWNMVRISRARSEQIVSIVLGKDHGRNIYTGFCDDLS